MIARRPAPAPFKGTRSEEMAEWLKARAWKRVWGKPYRKFESTLSAMTNADQPQAASLVVNRRPNFRPKHTRSARPARSVRRTMRTAAATSLASRKRPRRGISDDPLVIGERCRMFDGYCCDPAKASRFDAKKSSSLNSARIFAPATESAPAGYRRVAPESLAARRTAFATSSRVVEASGRLRILASSSGW